MNIELLPKGTWIRLSSYEPGGVLFTNYYQELKGLTLKCNITYPLHVPCTFDIAIPKNGCPVNHIIESIVNKYREIYKEEEESITQMVTARTLLNRGSSNGKWRIWGHVLQDLDLVGIIWDTETNELQLEVDS